MIQTFIENGKTYAKLADLHVWESNPKTVLEEDYARLEEQFKLGEYKPLLVLLEDGTVLGGNTRMKLYANRNVENVWISPIELREEEGRWYAYIDGQKKERSFIDKKQALIEYALSDNDQVGRYSSESLAELVAPYQEEIQLQDYKIDIADPVSVQSILDSLQPSLMDHVDAKDFKEDEIPEINNELPVSQVGEIYQLGKHRLMCGDATSIDNVKKLMNGNNVDCIYTDPPYGINLETDYEWSRGNEDMGIEPSKGYDRVEGDDESFDYQKFAWINAKEEFWWGADYYIKTLPEGGSWIVWDKKNDDLKEVWTNEFELLWSKSKHKKYVIRILWNGALGTESEDIKKRVHPTQKSIRVVGETLNRLSNDTVNILDLFGGSGSTLIACEQANRTCYMMEIDPKYCDVIRKRYAKFIGQEDKWQELSPIIDEINEAPPP